MNEIQKKIDEAVEEFRKKLDEVYNDNIELMDTQVEMINDDLGTVIYPIEHFSCGTVLNCGGWVAFCIINNRSGRHWVTANGEQFSDEQLADLTRYNGSKVMVIHEGM